MSSSQWEGRHLADLDRSPRCTSVGWPLRREDADDIRLEPGAAARDQPCPSFAPERFPDPLIRRPRPSPRCWKAEAKCRESPSAPEVSKLNVELPGVLVVGDRVRGREPAFGKPPVPLRHCRRGLVDEVEALDDLAALPAPLRRLRRSAEQVGAVRGVAGPLAADVDARWRTSWVPQAVAQLRRRTSRRGC
jgi:hypothetical protein